MTEIEKKALALVNEAISADQLRILPQYVDKAVLCEALCRAIEQHEAFRQEVSDAVREWFDGSVPGHFQPFIIAKPDPLVEVREEAKTQGVAVASIHERPTGEELRLMKSAADCVLKRFEQALAARGLKIVEDK